MKSKFIFWGFALALIAFYTFKLSPQRYASSEASKICQWLNRESTSISFRVGPQALEHLTALRDVSSTEYFCTVLKDNLSFDHKNEVSILVSNGLHKLRLIYGSGSVKRLFLPTYYQHSSSHQHHHR